MMLLMPAMAHAAEDPGWSFNEETGELRIWKDFEDFNSSSTEAWRSSKNLIKSVVIEDGVTKIAAYSFYKCEGFTSVEIPNSVTSIGGYAFSGCSGLTSVVIPNSVTSIGEYAFYECSGLTSIKVAGGNTNYDSRGDCNAIIETATNSLIVGCKNTVIPNSVTSIGDCAFAYCRGLTSVEIPNSVTSIGGYAFRGCSGLTSVEIPNSVTSLGECAFYSCSSLTSVEIPNSVTSIGNGAFYDCGNLEIVNYVGSMTEWLNIEYGNCGSVFNDNSAELYINGELVTDVIVPEGVKQINGHAFCHYKHIKSIIIPEGVTSIGECAFYGCSGLKSVVIPNSVTSIGAGVFVYCSGLTSVVIPNMTSIGFAFTECRVDKIDFTGTVDEWCNKKWNPLTITGGRSYDLYFSGEEALSVTIPNSVTSIGNYAFKYCRNMTSVTIPSSVTSIGNQAFYGCSNLKTVYTDKEDPSILRSALGTSRTYIVPCNFSDELVAKYTKAGLKTLKQHDLVKTEVLAATCIANGHIEGYTCNYCGKHFADEEATTEIAENSWVTAISSNNHENVVTDDAIAATCTETGLTEGSHCEACHTTIVAQTATDAIGHDYTNYVYNNDATTDADGTETAECGHGCGETDTRTAEGTKITSTGVGQVSGDKQIVVKTIENGRVVIIRDGKKFDLAGRVVE